MVWNSEISGKKRLNRDNLYQQWDKCWKKEIKYFLSTGWKMSKIKTRNLHRYCSLSCSCSLSLSLSCKFFIGLGCQFSYSFLGNQTKFSTQIFLLFSLQLVFFFFFPYFVIHLVDFELLWFLFLFLNLKCCEFEIFCIVCFHCDCRCIGSLAQLMVKESLNFTICGIENKSVSWWVSEWVAGSW